MTDFFIIADQEIGASCRTLACFCQRLDRCDDIRDTGVVVEEPRADESVSHFDARIEGDAIPDVDPKCARFFLRASTRVETHLNTMIITRSFTSHRALNLTRPLIDYYGAAYLLA